MKTNLANPYLPGSMLVYWRVNNGEWVVELGEHGRNRPSRNDYTDHDDNTAT